MKMAKLFLCVAFIVVIKFGMTEAALDQILIRDRLLMLMCDQMTSYMQNGTMPRPVSGIPEIPDKYKTFVAATGVPNSGGGESPDSGLSGRKVGQTSQKTGRTSPNDLVKPRKYRREAATTLQEDFEECSKPGANCVLDLQ